MATKREFQRRKRLNPTSGEISSSDDSKSLVTQEYHAINKYKEVVPEGESFDISSLTLEQLARDIKSSYDKKEPMTVFFRKRQVKKLTLDIERQALLLDRVSWLRRQGAEIMAMRADAILSERAFILLIEKREREAQLEIERTLSSHNLAIFKESSEYKVIDAQLRMLEAQAEKLEIANQSERAKAKFIEDFFSKIDIQALPPALQVYVISKLFDDGNSAFGDFENAEILKKHLEKQLTEENRKREYEANSLQSQSELNRSSADVSIKDFKKSL